ncbi:unnamed protein product, partial [Closterium sp. Yama58-4]
VDPMGVQSLVRRIAIFVRDSGEHFGTDTSKRLLAFLARHSLSRTVTVEGVDGDGCPRCHTFRLHEEELTGYSNTPGGLESCRLYGLAEVDNLQRRFNDLDTLDGGKLFMPETWLQDTVRRNEDCVAHLDSLFHLFHIGERGGVLP